MCTRVPESSMEDQDEAAFQQLAPPMSTSDRSDFPAPEHNSWHADWHQNRDRSKPFLVRQRLRQLARKWSGRPLLHYQRSGASLRLVCRCDRRHRTLLRRRWSPCRGERARDRSPTSGHCTSVVRSTNAILGSLLRCRTISSLICANIILASV